jgi:hypothetical protein
MGSGTLPELAVGARRSRESETGCVGYEAGEATAAGTNRLPVHGALMFDTFSSYQIKRQKEGGKVESELNRKFSK